MGCCGRGGELKREVGLAALPHPPRPATTAAQGTATRATAWSTTRRKAARAPDLMADLASAAEDGWDEG